MQRLMSRTMILVGTLGLLHCTGGAGTLPGSSGGGGETASSSSGGTASSGGVADAGNTSSSSSTGGTCSPLSYSDVAPIMTAHCTTCHRSNGSAVALDTYQSGLQPSSTAAYAGHNRWEASAGRMADNSMPPGGGLSPALITTMQQWVAAGYPQVSACATDAGVIPVPDAGPPVGPNCNGSTMTNVGSGGSMRPGVDCINCHNFSIGGTVMRDHYRDNCNGVGGVTVEITGSNGTVRTLTTNSAGNFYTNQTVTTPYSARVRVSGGTWTPMVAHQTAGGCNQCHTVNGTNGAAGRIVAP